MRKEYKKPEISVYEMESMQMLAISDSETFDLKGRTNDYNEDMW
ncbi:MAG: hypothetical protein ACI4TW_08650 [Prevotella sp.]